MDLQKCFEILDLDINASFGEVKRAYRDAVTVWHPDRFPQNARLKKKAEVKLKEINTAFEALMSHFAQESKIGPAQANFSKKADQATKKSETSKTEAMAELGTRLILHACHYLYKSIRASFSSSSNRSGQIHQDH